MTVVGDGRELLVAYLVNVVDLGRMGSFKLLSTFGTDSVPDARLSLMRDKGVRCCAQTRER